MPDAAPTPPQTAVPAPPPAAPVAMMQLSAPAPSPAPAQSEVQPGGIDRPDDQFPITAQPPTQPILAGETVSWTASEFVAHHKTGAWYLGLVGATVAVTAAVYFFTRDFITIAVLSVGAATFAFYAGRQPRQLSYQLDNDGLTIGTRHFPYGNFRSFALVQEGAFASIILTPLKRFAPLTTIYFPPEGEERIVGMLTSRLPVENYRHDAVDRLMQRIRF